MAARKHYQRAPNGGFSPDRAADAPPAARAAPAPGVRLLRGFLDLEAQGRLLAAVALILAQAPPFRPTMPGSGRPFSVLMTNAGPLGWVSDRTGYRYQDRHPLTGLPWPAVAEPVLEVWRAVAGYRAPPEACLVNLYAPAARMGLHQDRDEAALDAPVVSLSLGAGALFRLGGTRRDDPTLSFRLDSGDVLVLEGPSRLAFHGIDRVLSGTSPLPPLPGGAARINLTLRRVTTP
jgi:DNA oxidative demethylase